MNCSLRDQQQTGGVPAARKDVWQQNGTHSKNSRRAVGLEHSDSDGKWQRIKAGKNYR